MRLSIIIILAFFSFSGKAQNTDTLPAKSQLIELFISTPQPRVGATFQLLLEVKNLGANIFKPTLGKVKFANTNADNRKMTWDVYSFEKGKNEIGPLDFVINDTKYRTNKVSYEVVDALPDTDKGIWFRKVKTSDSTFCIIIEQRIPFAKSTESNNDQIVRFVKCCAADGLKSRNSKSSTVQDGFRDIDGVLKSFKYSYAVYNFEITDKNKKITITKDKLENLPGDYQFVDIVVQ
jgi:hypothetical protein